MAANAKLVGVEYGGEGPGETVLSDWHKIRFVVQGFENLKHKRDEFVLSPLYKCHGYHWKVQLYPRGNAKSSEESEHISVFLSCESVTEDDGIDKLPANISFTFQANEERVPFTQHSNTTYGKAENCFKSWGWPDFVPRANVLNQERGFITRGNLITSIDIAIQVAMEQPKFWTPHSSLSRDMLDLLERATEENSDVIFQVGKGRTTKKKKGKTLFYAHRAVLSARSTEMAELTEDYDADTPIPIDDVDPDVFYKLLRYVYGGEIPDRDILREEAATLISVADRFTCTGLKLAAEAELVASGITVDNAAEMILFADAKNCAMLKEAALDFFVMKGHDVMETEGFEKLGESCDLMKEVMTAALAGSQKRAAPAAPEDRDYKRMRVSALRRKLDMKDLDVDGSREMLISRLEEADKEEDGSDDDSDDGEDSNGSEDEQEDEE